jgi:UDP-N-acetylmuramate dehydrogenase
MLLQENVPLAPLTTFKVGGPARYFIEASSEGEVLQAVSLAKERSFPLFVLGGGSNILMSDKGFPGLVLRIALKGIAERKLSVPGESAREFSVGAGEDWDAFVALAVEHDCQGIENLSGIPGTVGGTPVQNVGAYGQEVSETIISVRALDTQTLKLIDFSNAQCGFAYRTSIFNSTAAGRFIVTQVKYLLHPGGEPKIEYADLTRYFIERKIAKPGLLELRNAVREIRAQKGMVIIPGDPDCLSAGSFFKNPIVPRDVYERATAVAGERGKQIPSYPAPEGMIKLSAAWLVENSGFRKGFTRNGVGVSSKHALAIVNRGSATAADVIALKNDIQRRVREVYGVELNPEPVLVGEF